MQTFAQKQNQSRKETSSILARYNAERSGPKPLSHSILHLQRTMGNRAVMTLQTNAKKLALTGTAVNSNPGPVRKTLEISTVQRPTLARFATAEPPPRPVSVRSAPPRTVPTQPGWPAPPIGSRSEAPTYLSSAQIADINSERQRLTALGREAIRDYEHPHATLVRGGTPAGGFVTTDRWDPIQLEGTTVTAQWRSFHLLDAMEADIARATTDQEAARYILGYLNDSALRLQDVGYLRRDVIIEPNLDPGGTRRLATARAALARRAASRGPQPTSTPAPEPRVTTPIPSAPPTTTSPRGSVGPQPPTTPGPTASPTTQTSPSTATATQAQTTPATVRAPLNVRTVDPDLASACVPWNAAFDASWVTNAHRDAFTTNWIGFVNRRTTSTTYGQLLQDFLSALHGQTMAAAIVVVDATGCMVAYARAYRTVGMEAHAEELCMATLDRQLARVPPARLRGSRMHVTANAQPCRAGQYGGNHDCRGRLMTLAGDHGVAWGNVIVQPRPELFDLAVEAVRNSRGNP